MLNKKMEVALNTQLNYEFYSSYLYLSMSAYFENKNLSGFANWMNIQSQEEYMHAQKFYNYILQKGGAVILKEISSPKTNWNSTLEAFEDTYQHEQKITKLIDDLVNLSIEVKDHATSNFLQWFVNEQVEEEANVTKIINSLKMIENNPNGIFMLDREFSQRTLTPISSN